MTRVVLVLMLAWGAGCGGNEEAHDEHEGAHDHEHDGVEDHAEDHEHEHVAEVHDVAEIAAGTGPVTLSDQGVRFDPPVAENRIPDGAFYCDMGTVHFAALQRNDGRCPVCGMELKEMDASAAEHEGHDHPPAAGDTDHDHDDDHDDDHAHDEGGMDHHDHDHE